MKKYLGCSPVRAVFLKCSCVRKFPEEMKCVHLKGLGQEDSPSLWEGIQFVEGSESKQRREWSLCWCGIWSFPPALELQKPTFPPCMDSRAHTNSPPDSEDLRLLLRQASNFSWSLICKHSAVRLSIYNQVNRITQPPLSFYWLCSPKKPKAQ